MAEKEQTQSKYLYNISATGYTFSRYTPKYI